MSIGTPAKRPPKKINRTVKPRTLKVISVCSVCGEPVTANSKDMASRHGFKRYKKKRVDSTFSQEDDKACAGSGKEVIYKRFKK
jgi:hypothetical protein